MRESLKPIEPGCLVWNSVLRAQDRVVEPWSVDKPACSGVKRLNRAPIRCRGCKTVAWWLTKETEATKEVYCECVLIRLDPDDDQRATFERERIEDEAERVAQRYRRLLAVDGD